ncbi:MAG TPA: hypothetical protein PKY78_04720 [Candidatus Omnitrophota bacterium]|nr:hypothetical protein [Candidatus Omnitrophota bacterium]
MIAYILIIAGLAARIIPHEPNLVPVAAIALFAGAYLNKKISPWVPFIIMAVSDVIIGLHDVVFFTWGAFIITGFMGMYLKQHRNPVSVFSMSILSAAMFFVITNFGVWMAWYPHTFAGLTDCYVKAVPFLRNTLLSNVIFTAALFGIYEICRNLVAKTRFSAVLLTE